MGKSQPSSAKLPSTPETDNLKGGYSSTQGAYQIIYVPSKDYPPPGDHPRHATQAKNQPIQDHQALSTAEPVDVLQNIGCWKDMRRNAPQSSSLCSSTLIFISGGMSLAGSVSFTPFTNLSDNALRHFKISWFIAVIIGSCVAATFIEKITMRLFNCVASILVIVNGILLISAPENLSVAFIARYCDGVAFGLTVIPTIVVGSELSVKRFRGYVLSVEQVGLITGMGTYLCMWSNGFSRMTAILPLIYGILAFGFTFIFTIESPISYLRKGNEVAAMQTLCWLQKPRCITNETHALLNENKHLLEEDIARGRNLNISIGLMPMVKLCLFRAFVTLSFSIPLTCAFVKTAPLDEHLDMLYICATMRVIGVAFAIFTLDILGRKVVSAISLLVGGGLLICVGTIYSDYWKLIDSDKEIMNTAKGLLMAYQVLAGLTAPASTCYLGEAFSISLKQYFILVAIVFENVIQIIICSAFGAFGTTNSISNFVYALGALQIAFAVLFFVGLPETKQTTLREALAKFRRILNESKGSCA